MKSHQIISLLNGINKKNIAIIGNMGCGKTAFGKLIAKKIDYKHIDSDKKIVTLSKKSINDIFKEDGENYFRKIESKIVLNLIDKKNIILSLGGGSIRSLAVRNKLIKNSLTVFLDVDLKILVSRLRKSKHRPLLLNTNIDKKIIELDIQRRKYYLKSDIKLSNTGDINNTYKIFKQEITKLYES